MSLLISLALGLCLSLVIGMFAYRRGSLTPSGVRGAVITGTAIFGFGGFVPSLLLVMFFVSSSLFSHYKARVKEQFSEKFQKGSRRDLGQALANGGWAALVALFIGAAQWNQWGARVQMLAAAAFVGAIATVTADTWATEIGVLSKSLPRMITNGRVVPAGTSGGITRLGTFVAFCGAAFIGIVSVLGARWIALEDVWLGVTGNDISSVLVAGGFFFIAIIALSGLGGALFDSLLGATVQAIYFCEYDETQTEKKVHGCGRTTRRVRGWEWLDNDMVNFLASVFGSLMAVVLVYFGL